MKLIKEIMEDTEFRKDALQVIKNDLEYELKKSDINRDYDKVNELTGQYAELLGIDEKIKNQTESGINELLLYSEKTKPKHKKLVLFRNKGFIAATCAVTLLFSANIFTLSAYGMNVFKTIIHYTKGGFSVELADDESADDDKYGIKAECAKYGIFPKVPDYLPDGFEMINVEQFNFENNNSIEFIFENENNRIVIAYDVFDDKEDMSEVGFPSDYYNLEKIQINGFSAIVSKEDGQFTLVYPYDTTIMSIYTSSLAYDECDEIIKSIN